MTSLSKVLLAIPAERTGGALIELAAAVEVNFAPSRCICLHYVLQGRLSIQCGAVTESIGRGDFVCLPRGGAHRIFTEGATETVRTKLLAALEFSDAPRRVRFGKASAPLGARLLSASCMLRGSGGVSPGSLMADMVVMRVGDGVLSSMPPPACLQEACIGSGAGAFAAGFMRMLFIQLVRLDVVRRHGGDILQVSNWPSNLVGHAQALIERYRGDPWSVATLAKTVGMSRARFAHMFAASTGQTPIAMLTAIRLDESARQLESSAGIGEIAHAVGYGSSAAFARAFRKRYGETPTTFRKRLMKEKLDAP